MGCAAVVLKPSVVGGVEITKDICDIVLELTSAIPVISSAFESPVSLTMNAKIAETLGKTTGGAICHGLDIGRWFVDETLNPSKTINETLSVCIDTNTFERDFMMKWAQSHFSRANPPVKTKQYNVSVEKEGVMHDISERATFHAKIFHHRKLFSFFTGLWVIKVTGRQLQSRWRRSDTNALLLIFRGMAFKRKLNLQIQQLLVLRIRSKAYRIRYVYCLKKWN